MRNEVIYDEQRDSCPYATLFVLFLCGQHKLGLKYAREFASEEFTELYSDYFNTFGCRGVPKDKVQKYY